MRNKKTLPDNLEDKADSKTNLSPFDRYPILGVKIEGDLQSIRIDRITAHSGETDRLGRPGDKLAIEELALSMRECGQLQPIMVEVCGKFYEVVFGRRRLAAAQRLDWTTIGAVVVPPLTPEVRRLIVTIENVQRQELAPAEETLAVAELMELQAFTSAMHLGKPLTAETLVWHGKVVTGEMVAQVDAKDRGSWSSLVLGDPRVRALATERVATMLGKTSVWVRDRMYIARLGKESRQLVLEGKLPLAHAREISKVADEKMRDRLAKDYASGGLDSISQTEPGALDGLREEVRRQVFSLHVVPWRLEVPFAGRKPCVGCEHNSLTHPGLFEGGGDVSLNMRSGRGTPESISSKDTKVVASGVCTLASCYADKLRTANGAISAAAKQIVNSEHDKPRKSEKTALPKVPEYISYKALENKIDERRKFKQEVNSASGHKPSPKTQPKKPDLLADARDKWRIAMDLRYREFEPKLAAKLKETPGGWCAFHLFTMTNAYLGTQGCNTKIVAKHRDGPVFAGLLKAAASPSWDSMVKIEADCGREFKLLNPWYDARSGVVDKIAKVFQIEISPQPTVESFLSSEPTRTPAPAEARNSKPTKARKPTKAAVDDDEPNHDALEASS